MEATRATGAFPSNAEASGAGATSEGGVRAALERYVSERFGPGVRIREVISADADSGEKGFGYGRPVRLTLDGLEGGERKVVLHVARGGGFGHDRLSDRAALAVLAWESFGAIPRHVRAVDVGVVERGGALRSLAAAQDFFFVTDWAEGRPYFHDLDEIAARGALDARDGRRLERLVDSLVEIHSVRRDDPEAYVRRTRELFGHHECIAGLIDSYDGPEGRRVVSPGALLEIERAGVPWRARLKRRVHRLARVHGDYHPWNLLFHDRADDRIDEGRVDEGVDERADDRGGDGDDDRDDELVLLDCSRGVFGEPADDLAALSINYLASALRTRGALEGPFAELWLGLFDRYLERTQDRELLEVIPPYLAWRALVVASPIWYPRYSTVGVSPSRRDALDEEVRDGLFGFIHRVLEVDHLEPAEAGRLLVPS